MITSRKISQVNVFAGSPWEVASVKNLLKAAYIEVSMKEMGGTVSSYLSLANIIRQQCV